MPRFVATFALLIGHYTAAFAASVDLTPAAQGANIGESITVLVSAAAMPSTDGPTLAITYNASVLRFVGLTLPAESPFTDTLFFDDPLTDNFVDFIGAMVPLQGPAASGDFPAFEVVFEAVGAGSSDVALFEDGVTYFWPESVTASPITGIAYGTAQVSVTSPVPLPGALWMFGCAVLLFLGWCQRTARSA